MKRLLTILLILLLLFLSACGKGQTETEGSVSSVPVPPVTEEEPAPEPEPEPEPTDPRELWDTAASFAKAYDDMEYESRGEISMTMFYEDQTAKYTTMFRGRDMNSLQMQVESVTTGDSPYTYYYADSTYYTDDGLHRRSCMMTPEEFWDYQREGSNPFTQEYFETVELISEEDGWEIAFSDPTEAYEEAFAASALSASGMRLKEGTLLSEGTIQLDRDGHYLGHTQEISCTVLVYRNTEADYSMKTVRRWLSHDEPVTVMLPKNLDTYTPVEDIRLVDLADQAFWNHNAAYAAEYGELISFTGTVGGINCALEQNSSVAFQLDMENNTIRFRRTHESAATVSAQTEAISYEAAYESGKLTTTWGDGSETEEMKQEKEVIDGAWGNYVVLTSDERQACYAEPVYVLEDGICTVYINPDIHISELLFPYVFYAIEVQTNGGLFEVIDYEIRESSGELIIEEETEQLKKISLYANGTFTLADGTVFEGAVLMEQTFEGYDRDVVIAPGEDGIRRP